MKYPGRMMACCCGILVAALTVYIIYAADTGTLPPFIIRLYRFPGGDKVGHVLVFGLLALGVTALLYPRRIRLFRAMLPAGAVLVALLVTLEEASQWFIASRSFDLVDLACSYLGIFLGTAVGHMAFMLNRNRSTR